MKRTIRNDVVDRPVEEGTRLVLAALQAAADDASARLAAARDEEALHDFRVALRRLRSTLRAYRPWIGALIGRRVEKKLRRCARATNSARDIEVQLAWLVANEPGLSDRDRPGAAALRTLLRNEGKEAAPISRVLERYRSASDRLRGRLRREERGEAEVDARPFGHVLATLASRQLRIVVELARSIRSAREAERIHRTRIEAKRLRYLLEPIRGNRHADTREAVRQLRRFQDVLGELHDLDVLAAYVRRTRREVGPGAARPGLAAIERMSSTRRRALFDELRREWRAGGLPALAREVDVRMGALRARASGTRPAPRRSSKART